MPTGGSLTFYIIVDNAVSSVFNGSSVSLWILSGAGGECGRAHAGRQRARSPPYRACPRPRPGCVSRTRSPLTLKNCSLQREGSARLRTLLSSVRCLPGSHCHTCFCFSHLMLAKISCMFQTGKPMPGNAYQFRRTLRPQRCARGTECTHTRRQSGPELD